jgi:hypothetical protein
LIVALGTAVRQAPSLGGNQTGHVSHDNESFTYRTIDGGGGGGTSPMDTMVMATMRMGVGLPRPFYFAVDSEIGGIASAGPSAEMTTSGMRGTPTITQRSAIAINILGVVGARTRAGSGSLGLEVAGGVHYVSHTFHSQYLACEQVMNVSGMAPLLEVRATAERWLNPWLNVGAMVGGSVIDRGAWIGGVYFGLQTRAYAGER